ncbi:MAG: PIN domain-containing protein [Candidatus Aenigmarchaeota archaeon]|nr:PIN domain-containing protein [Candidatus Aenigmarchaeota archaeon]
MLLDTSAWIELFIKSKLGKKVAKIIENGQYYTSLVTIAEISNWTKKQGLDESEYIFYITKLTQVLDLSTEIAKTAGKLKYERNKTIKKFGMIDAIILATSIEYNLKILTKDSDFKGLENVELL